MTEQERAKNEEEEGGPQHLSNVFCYVYTEHPQTELCFQWKGQRHVSCFKIGNSFVLSRTCPQHDGLWKDLMTITQIGQGYILVKGPDRIPQDIEADSWRIDKVLDTSEASRYYQNLLHFVTKCRDIDKMEILIDDAFI